MRVPPCPAVHGHMADSVRDHEPRRVVAIGGIAQAENTDEAVHPNLCVPKTCATWADASTGSRRIGPVSGTLLAGADLAGPCDDLRLVGLNLIFLIVFRAVSLLGLSRRESWWKDAEILMLRHQLAVAQREHPQAHARLAWPDRAWLALLAGTLPIVRLAAMRLIVTPGTILRWRRDIVRRRWARLSRRGRSGRPATDRKVRSVVLRLARENAGSGSWVPPGTRSNRGSSSRSGTCSWTWRTRRRG